MSTPTNSKTKATADTASASEHYDFPMPPATREISETDLQTIVSNLHKCISILEQHTTVLNPTDRRRQAPIGLKREGFVTLAVTLCREHPQFMPNYIDKKRLQQLEFAFEHFSLIATNAIEVRDLATDARIVLTTELYRSMLAFYDVVKRAALVDRIAEAIAIYRLLEPAFKSMSKKAAEGSEPTEKQVVRDVKDLLKGQKDGKVVVENEQPDRPEKGAHVVVDETEKKRPHGEELEVKEV